MIILYRRAFLTGIYLTTLSKISDKHIQRKIIIERINNFYKDILNKDDIILNPPKEHRSVILRNIEALDPSLDKIQPEIKYFLNLGRILSMILFSKEKLNVENKNDFEQDYLTNSDLEIESDYITIANIILKSLNIPKKVQKIIIDSIITEKIYKTILKKKRADVISSNSSIILRLFDQCVKKMGICFNCVNAEPKIIGRNINIIKCSIPNYTFNFNKEKCPNFMKTTIEPLQLKYYKVSTNLSKIAIIISIIALVITVFF